MKSSLSLILIVTGLALCSENQKEKSRTKQESSLTLTNRNNISHSDLTKNSRSVKGSELSTGSSRHSRKSRKSNDKENLPSKDTEKTTSSSIRPSNNVSTRSAAYRNSLSRSTTVLPESSLHSISARSKSRNGSSKTGKVSIQIPESTRSSRSSRGSEVSTGRHSRRSQTSKTSRNSVSKGSAWNHDPSVSVSQRNEGPAWNHDPSVSISQRNEAQGHAWNQDPSVSVSQRNEAQGRNPWNRDPSVSVSQRNEVLGSTSSQGGWKELEALLRRRKREILTFEDTENIPAIKREVDEDIKIQMAQFEKKCKLGDKDMIVDRQNHTIKFELRSFDDLREQEAFLLMYMSYEYIGEENKRNMSSIHTFLLAKAEGHVVGFAKIEFSSQTDLEEPRYYIMMVFTEKEFIKYKVSQRLVKLIVDTVRQLKGESVDTMVVDLRNKDEMQAFESNHFLNQGQTDKFVGLYELFLRPRKTD